MELTSFFNWFWGIVKLFADFLDTAVMFTAFGVTVSYLNLIGAALALGMIVTLFWKGARA